MEKPYFCFQPISTLFKPLFMSDHVEPAYLIKEGDTYTYPFKFTQEEVVRFAELTGDKNPVHLDPAYAAKTIFRKPVVHGMFGASMFSKVFGMLYPGEGTIYLNQTIKFLAPMYVERDYQVEFRILEVIRDKNRARVETLIRDIEQDRVITTGEAIIMHPEKIRK